MSNKEFGYEKLYNVKAYHNGRCFGYALEFVTLDDANQYLNDHQGNHGWEYFIVDAESENNIVIAIN